MAPTSKQIYSVDHGSMKNMAIAMSTPNFIPPAVHKGVETPKLSLPKMKPMGANAQTDAMGRAMRSAFKSTQTFGVPGAK